MSATRVERARRSTDRSVGRDALCVAAEHGVPVLEEIQEQVRGADELLEETDVDDQVLEKVIDALPAPLSWLPVGWVASRVADAVTDVVADALLSQLIDDLTQWRQAHCAQSDTGGS